MAHQVYKYLGVYSYTSDQRRRVYELIKSEINACFDVLASLKLTASELIMLCNRQLQITLAYRLLASPLNTHQLQMIEKTIWRNISVYGLLSKGLLPKNKYMAGTEGCLNLVPFDTFIQSPLPPYPFPRSTQHLEDNEWAHVYRFPHAPAAMQVSDLKGWECVRILEAIQHPESSDWLWVHLDGSWEDRLSGSAAIMVWSDRAALGLALPCPYYSSRDAEFWAFVQTVRYLISVGFRGEAFLCIDNSQFCPTHQLHLTGLRVKALGKRYCRVSSKKSPSMSVPGGSNLTSASAARGSLTPWPNVARMPYRCLNDTDNPDTKTQSHSKAKSPFTR